MTRPSLSLKNMSIASLSVWLGLFALLPLLLVLLISLQSHSSTQAVVWKLSTASYTNVFSSIFYRIFMHSLTLSALVTFICLVIAYPAAFILANIAKEHRSLFIMLLIIPFWTSSLVRTYAILTLIKAKGLLNTALLTLGIIHHPLQILYTNTAVVIGLTYNLLPYMIFPLYSNIEKLDHSIFDAAKDLGANRRKIFMDITFPLTLPGIIAGSMLVFLPAMTLFYIPNLLGGAKSLLLGNLIKNQFLSMNNWPAGCATSIVLTVIMFFLIWIYKRTNRDTQYEGLL